MKKRGEREERKLIERESQKSQVGSRSTLTGESVRRRERKGGLVAQSGL